MKPLTVDNTYVLRNITYMMVSLFEIARQTSIPPSSLYRSLTEGMSIKRALLLEQATGVDRIAWLFKERYFNPLIPYTYKGPWPPKFFHLEGEAYRWAEEIIKAFPDRPPTREEFKAWKRKYRRKAEAVHG